ELMDRNTRLMDDTVDKENTLFFESWGRSVQFLLDIVTDEPVLFTTRSGLHKQWTVHVDASSCAGYRLQSFLLASEADATRRFWDLLHVEPAEIDERLSETFHAWVPIE